MVMHITTLVFRCLPTPSAGKTLMYFCLHCKCNYPKEFDRGLFNALRRQPYWPSHVDVTGVYNFQKVFISSPPTSPHHYISSTIHAHIFIVPSLISTPISILAELFPYPKSREFARIYTPGM